MTWPMSVSSRRALTRTSRSEYCGANREKDEAVPMNLDLGKGRDKTFLRGKGKHDWHAKGQRQRQMKRQRKGTAGKRQQGSTFNNPFQCSEGYCSSCGKWGHKQELQTKTMTDGRAAKRVACDGGQESEETEGAVICSMALDEKDRVVTEKLGPVTGHSQITRGRVRSRQCVTSAWHLVFKYTSMTFHLSSQQRQRNRLSVRAGKRCC
eukprot:6435419-Amphidinium_carterae.1